MKKNKKKERKHRIKKFVDFVFNSKDKELLGHEWVPKLSRKLKSFSLICKIPLGKNNYAEKLLQITEWDNGEGYDFSYSDRSHSEMFSMHTDEIDLLLKGLDMMNYFDFKKSELREQN